MNRRFWISPAWAFVLTLLGWIPASLAAEADDEGRTRKDWYTQFSHSRFAQHPAAQRRIEPGALDYDLLNAAVFHETNRRRQQHDLPVLKYNPKAAQAARLQSAAMRKGNYIGHVNPDQPDLRTLQDRLTKVDVRPSFAAENVATAFVRRYEGGRQFYIRQEEGETVYSYEPRGKPIPYHSYVSFAEALVGQWMKSPGHRKNILHEKPEFLGCSCLLADADEGMRKAFCTQVFLTPFPNAGARTAMSTRSGASPKGMRADRAVRAPRGNSYDADPRLNSTKPLNSRSTIPKNVVVPTASTILVIRLSVS